MVLVLLPNWVQPLASLGVHRHWDNPLDKQYSRNLGLEEGIELIYAPPIREPESGDLKP